MKQEKPEKNQYDRKAYEDDSPELNLMMGWDKCCDAWEAYYAEKIDSLKQENASPQAVTLPTKERLVEIMTPTEWIYEVARLEAIASGRSIVPEPWSERDEKFRSQMTKYVEGLRGKPLPTPEEAHDSWWREYEKMGWVYGEVRDTIAKTHPDMKPFKDLPKDERDKDEIFLALVEFAFKFLPSPKRLR